MSDVTKKHNYPIIGELALKHSLIKQQDLEKAIAACSDTTDRDKALEEYLVSEKLVSKLNMKRLKTAARAMAMRQKDIRFGTIAVNMKFVTKSLIEMALAEQKNEITKKKKAKRIGKLLVEAGIISSTEKEIIIKEQHRLQREKDKFMHQTVEFIDDGKESLEDVDKRTKPLSDQTGTQSDQPDQERKRYNVHRTQDRTKMFPKGIKLVISDDGLTAYISKTKKFNKNIKTDDILEILKKEHIKFGIVDKTLIKGFIKSNIFLKQYFKIAQGAAPDPGKDGKINYFFDTNRLKPGRINENGDIDFKERGDIPYVEEGTILAEKIPMVKEKPGKNIFGDIITIRPAVDAKLKYDKGAKFSENSTKIVASINGQPKLSWSGVISVLDDFVTKTDVNYETGHVEYHGNIKIKGCVQNGFKVRGNNIFANEIDGGIIHAERDLQVSGIIRNARIYSRGNIWAKFIQKSEILCMGDIHTTKEIVESKIKNSGACILKRGKIISSEVTSKMGVYAKDIGTDISKPTHIRTGIDVFMPEETEKLEKKIAEQKKKITAHRDNITELEEDNKKHQDKITKLAQIQDRAEIEQKNIDAKISSLNRAYETEEIRKLEDRLKDLKKEAEKAEKKLTIYFNKTDIQDKKIARLNVSVALQEEKLKEFITEKKNLIEWGEETSGVVIVKVTGTIMAGTIVAGKHSEKRIARKLKNAIIKEVMVTRSQTGKKEAPHWEMHIFPG